MLEKNSLELQVLESMYKVYFERYEYLVENALSQFKKADEYEGGNVEREHLISSANHDFQASRVLAHKISDIRNDIVHIERERKLEYETFVPGSNVDFLERNEDATEMASVTGEPENEVVS